MPAKYLGKYPWKHLLTDPPEKKDLSLTEKLKKKAPTETSFHASGSKTINFQFVSEKIKLNPFPFQRREV